MTEPREIRECFVCEIEDVPGLTINIAGSEETRDLCQVCYDLGLEYFALLDMNPAYVGNSTAQSELGKAISLGIRGLHDRIEALADELEDAEEPSVTRALVMALSRLRDACLQADGEGELSDHVDGSCLDAATAALTLATRGVAKVLNAPDPPEHGDGPPEDQGQPS